MNLKSFLAATALLLTVASLSAQTTCQAGVTFGSNYSLLRSDLFSTTQGNIAPVGGFSFLLNFNDRFELNQEIVYTRKGSEVKAVHFMPEEKVENTTFKYQYQTFETALFAGYQPMRDVPVRLQAGGFFGTCSTPTTQNNASDLWIGNYEDVNLAMPVHKLYPAFNGLDYGPAVGISAGNRQFRANLRYYLGARNLYNNLDFVKQDGDVRTQSVRLTLTYFLR